MKELILEVQDKIDIPSNYFYSEEFMNLILEEEKMKIINDIKVAVKNIRNMPRTRRDIVEPHQQKRTIVDLEILTIFNIRKNSDK